MTVPARDDAPKPPPDAAQTSKYRRRLEASTSSWAIVRSTQTPCPTNCWARVHYRQSSLLWLRWLLSSIDLPFALNYYCCCCRQWTAIAWNCFPPPSPRPRPSYLCHCRPRRRNCCRCPLLTTAPLSGPTCLWWRRYQ